MAGERIVLRGPVELGTVGAADELTNFAKVTLVRPAQIDEAADATIGHTARVHVNTDWTATVEFEYAATARGQAALSIGTYAGVYFREHSLTVEANLREGTGGMDDVKMYTPENYTWSVEASKWEASDSIAVFLALLAIQEATPWAAVAFTSAGGSGQVLIERAQIAGGGEIANESMTCQGAGALTSSDPLITLLIAAVTASLTDGYAAALEFNLTDHDLTGLCYVKSVKLTNPSQGKCSATLEVQGTGALGAIPPEEPEG